MIQEKYPFLCHIHLLISLTYVAMCSGTRIILPIPCICVLTEINKCTIRAYAPISAVRPPGRPQDHLFIILSPNTFQNCFSLYISVLGSFLMIPSECLSFPLCQYQSAGSPWKCRDYAHITFLKGRTHKVRKQSNMGCTNNRSWMFKEHNWWFVVFSQQCLPLSGHIPANKSFLRNHQSEKYTFSFFFLFSQMMKTHLCNVAPIQLTLTISIVPEYNLLPLYPLQ